MPNTRATAQRRNRTAAAARRSRGHWGSTRSARATARHTPGSRTPAPRSPACRFRVPRRSALGMARLIYTQAGMLAYIRYKVRLSDDIRALCGRAFTCSCALVSLGFGTVLRTVQLRSTLDTQRTRHTKTLQSCQNHSETTSSAPLSMRQQLDKQTFFFSIVLLFLLFFFSMNAYKYSRTALRTMNEWSPSICGHPPKWSPSICTCPECLLPRPLISGMS